MRTIQREGAPSTVTTASNCCAAPPAEEEGQIICTRQRWPLWVAPPKSALHRSADKRLHELDVSDSVSVANTILSKSNRNPTLPSSPGALHNSVEFTQQCGTGVGFTDAILAIVVAYCHPRHHPPPHVHSLLPFPWQPTQSSGMGFGSVLSTRPGRQQQFGA
jgi:hypothetical protein